jgi:hypothetical protein
MTPIAIGFVLRALVFMQMQERFSHKKLAPVRLADRQPEHAARAADGAEYGFSQAMATEFHARLRDLAHQRIRAGILVLPGLVVLEERFLFRLASIVVSLLAREQPLYHSKSP